MDIAVNHLGGLRCRPMLSESQNIIDSLKHPKEVAPDCSSLKWLMVDAAYQSDHLRCWPISPRWHNVIQNLSHPDELASGRISSPMNYCQCRMSPNLLTLLSHPDDLCRCAIRMPYTLTSKSSGWHSDNWPSHLDNLIQVGILSGCNTMQPQVVRKD